ncbi:MAG: hypothetical protein ABSH22_14375 [Tepidisphaeraceae bacterium]
MGQLSALTAQPADATGSPRRANSWRPTLLFFVVSFALVFGAFSVGRKLNVDENVFTATAALLSRHAILQYRDYHYNHLPTLVFIYAGLFKLTNYLLLSARTFCALSAAATAAAIYYFARESFAFLPPRRRQIFALGIGILFLANPLFTHTAGRAWNHDFPILMSVLAFVILSRALANSRAALVALAGFLVGLAVTARLTFATELFPFGLFLLIYPRLRISKRIALCALFAVGFLIAALPTIWVWAQSPTNAYFGNFQYPALNTLWHFDHDDLIHHRDTLLSKLYFFIKKTWELPGNGIVTWGFLSLIVLARFWNHILQDPWRTNLFILILLAASQLAAGLVPSPPFEQYYYAATPFMILAITLCLARLPDLALNPKNTWIWITCLIVTIGFAIPEYRDFPVLFWPPAWFPVRAHDLGQRIAKASGPGPVLTLDPIYVLEGGLDIYPQLATGPFGIRVGDYLTPAQRAQYKMWGTDDLKRLFEQTPPPKIMISPGSDGDIEALLTQLAKSHGYREVDVNTQKPGVIILWLPPPQSH